MKETFLTEEELELCRSIERHFDNAEQIANEALATIAKLEAELDQILDRSNYDKRRTEK